MNKRYAQIASLILGLALIPNLVFAAWWNPLSWFAKNSVQITATSTVTTTSVSVQISTTTKKVILPIKKVSIKPIASVPVVMAPIAQTPILKTTPSTNSQSSATSQNIQIAKPGLFISADTLPVGSGMASVPVLVLDAQSTLDGMTISAITVHFKTTGGNIKFAYLSDGSQELTPSFGVVGNQVTFSDLKYLVPANTAKTITIVVDVDSATVVSAAINSLDVIVHDAYDGNAVIVGGSAIGNPVTLYNSN